MSDRPDGDERRLHILHLLQAPCGDVFRHVVDLAGEQVARGHAVGLVTDSSTVDDRAATKLAAIEPMLELGVVELSMPRRLRLSDIATAWRIAAHARRLAADVVHAHDPKTGAYLRAPALPHGRGKTIRCYSRHGGGRADSRLLARRTDVVLFDSVFAANRFRHRVGDNEAIVRIVPYGIEEAAFEPVRPRRDAADFVFVGELTGASGIDTLIDATAILERRLRRGVRLVVVGDGPELTRLEQRAQARGIGDLVSFLGDMSPREAFAYGRALVVPSRAAGRPYLLLEAAGAQVPVIATDVDGIAEIFGPHRDRLVPCDDPTALAAAMESAFEIDTATMKTRAEELGSFVSSRFLRHLMGHSVIAAYEDAIARRIAETNNRGSRLMAVTGTMPLV